MPIVESQELNSIIPLSDLPTGGRGVIRQLRGGKDFTTRMAALGFTPETEVLVIQNFGHGPLLVEVRDGRVALGHGEALKVQVEAIRHVKK